MRKGYLVTLIGLVLILTLTAPAVVSAQSGAKIGFFSMEEILATSDMGKAANEEFKKIYEKSKTNIATREQELQRLKDELEKQRSILKEQALRDKEVAYQKKFRDYQDMVKDANDELNTRRQDMVNKYVPDILKIVKAIGESEKFTMIVDLSAVPVAFSNQGTNITKRIIDEFNKTYSKKK